MDKPQALKIQVWRYFAGFGTALALTAIAFWCVTSQAVTGGALVAVLMTLATIQLIVQLVFFLHVGAEARPRWNLTALLFTAIMLLVIVVGSLWIMNNLNYNMMMSKQQMDEYMMKQRDKGF